MKIAKAVVIALLGLSAVSMEGCKKKEEAVKCTEGKNDKCTSATASYCKGAGDAAVCAPCEGNDHCTHVTDKPTCKDKKECVKA